MGLLRGQSRTSSIVHLMPNRNRPTSTVSIIAAEIMEIPSRYHYILRRFLRSGFHCLIELGGVWPRRAYEQSACREEPAHSSTHHNLLMSEREVPLALTPASCASVYDSPQTRATQENPCFAKATKDRAVGN